jgi:hypothetical protein
MTLSSSSSLRVPYDVRPAKQTERRMFLELFSSLSRCGFQIPTYHYIGFGSIFFQDFRLFHRMLGVETMTSIEGSSEIIKRCKFNQPMKTIKLFEGMSSDYIPKIKQRDNYIIWFDYDYGINGIVSNDVVGCISKLGAGSLFFVTVDLELSRDLQNQSLRKVYEYFRAELPSFAVSGFTKRDFSGSCIVETYLKMIDRCVQAGLKGRGDISFETLVVITYADGHKMLTVGGMIADHKARMMLGSDSISRLWFLKRQTVTQPLNIPRIVLTRKEILYLERYCPSGKPALEKTGVDRDTFAEFQKFYRFWPSYFEIFA